MYDAGLPAVATCSVTLPLPRACGCGRVTSGRAFTVSENVYMLPQSSVDDAPAVHVTEVAPMLGV